MVWCKDNNLILNTSKTKEMTVDFRRARRTEHLPLHIHVDRVECGQVNQRVLPSHLDY